MGYNMSNDVALGQLSSAFVDTTATVTPPSGKVIIAITMLDDTSIDELVPEAITDATYKGPIDSGNNQGGTGIFGGTVGTPVGEINSFGSTAPTLANGSGAVAIAPANIFPKGITIYGRWKSFNLAAANSTGGVIFYMGK